MSSITYYFLAPRAAYDPKADVDVNVDAFAKDSGGPTCRSAPTPFTIVSLLIPCNEITTRIFYFKNNANAAFKNKIIIIIIGKE